MSKPFLLTVISVLLSACASPAPPSIRMALPDSPTQHAVRAEVEKFIGTRLRWGGTIALVENRPSETLIQVVSRTLDSEGRPRETDQSEGRFRARIPGFLDPQIYTRGRALTVVGTLVGEETGPIGEHAYRFPVLQVESYHLWERLPEWSPRDCCYWPPWYYDPWYHYYRPLYRRW